MSGMANASSATRAMWGFMEAQELGAILDRTESIVHHARKVAEKRDRLLSQTGGQLLRSRSLIEDCVELLRSIERRDEKVSSSTLFGWLALRHS